MEAPASDSQWPPGAQGPQGVTEKAETLPSGRHPFPARSWSSPECSHQGGSGKESSQWRVCSSSHLLTGIASYQPRNIPFLSPSSQTATPSTFLYPLVSELSFPVPCLPLHALSSSVFFSISDTACQLAPFPESSCLRPVHPSHIYGCTFRTWSLGLGVGEPSRGGTRVGERWPRSKI